MTNLIVSLALVNILAISPAKQMTNQEETITLFNQVAVEIVL